MDLSETSKMKKSTSNKIGISNGLLAVSIVCAIMLLFGDMMVDARSPINVMAMKWWKDNKPTKLKPR